MCLFGVNKMMAIDFNQLLLAAAKSHQQTNGAQRLDFGRTQTASG